MEKFPPKTWDVRHAKDFEDITVPAPAGSKFHLQALLIGKPCPGKEGQYKFLVSGSEPLDFSVDIRLVLDDPLFEDMYVECQLESGSKVYITKDKYTYAPKARKIK